MKCTPFILLSAFIESIWGDLRPCSGSRVELLFAGEDGADVVEFVECFQWA